MKAAQLLGERVRTLLGQHGKTQARVAADIGRGNSFMTDVVQGVSNTDLSALDDLARALNVQVADLFVDRDLSRQGHAVQQVLRAIVEGAPNANPAARARYFDEVLTAWFSVDSILTGLASEAVGEIDRTRQQNQSAHHHPDRKPRAPRAPKIAPTPKDK